jgi:hypothetical protein
MPIDKFSYSLMILLLLLSGCTTQEIVYAPPYTLPKQIIPANIDIKAKRENMRDVKHTLMLYNKLVDSIKIYHPKSNLDIFADELDKYIETYVNPVINDYHLSKNSETSAEIAKMYLIITSLYYKIDEDKHAREYIKLFQRRYGDNKNFFDLTLSSTDIAYSTLGEGMAELAVKVNYKGALRHPR